MAFVSGVKEVTDSKDYATALVFFTRSGKDTVAEQARLTSDGKFGIGLIPTQQMDIKLGGAYGINGISILSATALGSSVINSSLQTLGTIGIGTWNASTITEVYGGTNQTTYTLGNILYSSATNTLAKLAGNTTTTRNFLRQTGTGTVSAAPAWDTILAADVPGSALTKTDDTNVTLTLGGSPTTALLNAASLTLGWTGTLGLTRGGTAASLIASNGGIVYSGASALALLSGTATASQILTSGASTTPSWQSLSALTTAGTGISLSGTTNVTIALSTPVSVANGGTGSTSFTAGSVIFSNGTILTQNNANFFWDNTNNTLGLQTTSTVAGTALTAGGPIHNRTQGANSYVLNSAGANFGFIQNDAANKWSLGYGTAIGTLGTPVLTWNSSGNVGIGTAGPNYRLDVAGAVNSNSYLQVREGSVSPSLGAIRLTNRTVTGADGRIVWSTATDTGNEASIWVQGSGAGSGKMFFDVEGSQMVFTKEGNVGIGTTSPGSLLDVNGSSNFTTAITTGSTTFSLINTTATTVNFAGAATSLRMVASGGAMAIGGAVDADTQLYLLGTMGTSVSTAHGLFVNTTIQPSANSGAATARVQGTINKAGSGTHSDFMSLLVNAPVVGAGAASITNASTVKIGTAPTGATNNYALWVAAAGIRLDSTTANGTVATAMSSVGPTGANTTIQEWLTININGTTRYIPCF